MRDILVTLAVFGSLPFILRSAYVGILVWSWLSYMNPHRLAWGFAVTMPFAEIVAITTIISFILASERKRLVWSREATVLLVFVAWMFVTTTQSLVPIASWPQWDKVWKIQFMTLMTLLLIQRKERVVLLVWTIALSLGFYGVKGGIWVLGSGGSHRVLGPIGSFIAENNELGLALIMTVPLLWYLQLQAAQVWLRYGLRAAVALTLVAIVGTHSRGALVGLLAMGFFLILKSRRKVLPLLAALAFAAAVPYIMPEKWFERMETIETYEEDRSASERLRAWGNAVDLAKQRFTGGGYEALIYYGRRDAHSIYFEVLGEHGFVGLGLFLLLGGLTWRTATAIRKRSAASPDLRWAGDLAAMVQVSMVGYASAGAFLGLAYFDLYYHLVAIVILTNWLVSQQVDAAGRVEVESRQPPAERAPMGDADRTVRPGWVER